MEPLIKLLRGMRAVTSSASVSSLNAGPFKECHPVARGGPFRYGLLLLPAGGVISWQNHPECGAFAGTGFQFEAGIQEFAQTFHD